MLRTSQQRPVDDVELSLYLIHMYRTVLLYSKRE